MSLFISKICLCLRWLCLLMIFCNTTPSCQGVQKFCGDHLTESLDMICTNGYPKKIKKSIDPLDYYNGIEDDIQSPLDELPFFSKLRNNIFAKNRRRRFGVVDECCKKPCTLTELKSYCRQ